MDASQIFVSAGSGASVRLDGPQKAAVLLVSLGPDLASSVFRHLTEEEIEKLTQTISAMPRVMPETRDAVLDEFHAMIAESAYSDPAGPDYALTLLQRSFGSDKAAAIMDRVAAKVKEPPLNVVRKSRAGPTC